MLLESLWGVKLSRWEEKVVAAACLLGCERIPRGFQPEARERMQKAREWMGLLPSHWERELSFEIFVRSAEDGRA
ncbi:MAG: hypothetical protein GX589_06430 [Deltaproteobacteria bacterium]|nr:hypothetical protein [Deltaproteobacteria bacterium]